MKFLDLTHPIGLGTEGFPTCSRIIGWPMKAIDWAQYNMLHISMDLHTGTHLDGMLHCMPEGKDVASLPLNHCVGPAAVIDLQAKGGPGATFTVDDFKPHADRIRARQKVLVQTGWARHWGTDQYHRDFPGFEREAAQYLADLGIHLIGVEQASIHPTDHLEVHRIFFRKEIVIVEGLDRLAEIPVAEVDFSAAPLHFVGGDGSPVRAFCRFSEAA